MLLSSTLFTVLAVTTATTAEPSAQGQAAAELQMLLARSAELLALQPGRRIVMRMDRDGRPHIEIDDRSTDEQESLSATAGGPTLQPTGVGMAAGSPMGGMLTPEQRKILSFMSLHYNEGPDGQLLTTIRISGANVQIVNGTGSTDTVNAAGNLIVGYNEYGSYHGDNRSGSHNVIVGKEQAYASWGGLVVGDSNSIVGEGAVAFGRRNKAEGDHSAVTGGVVNIASGSYSSITAGQTNEARGTVSSITGGADNIAHTEGAAIHGGSNNDAYGNNTSILGGSGNHTEGYDSTAAGGLRNIVAGYWACIAGGSDNIATGGASFVAGGYDNVAANWVATVTGGSSNVAEGGHSVVSGGQSRVAAGDHDWVAGALFQGN